jgi:hypothetical protein
MPGQSSATFSIPEASMTFEVQVDPETGAFSTSVPEQLAPGTYSLLIDDQQVATFTVPSADTDSGDDNGILIYVILLIAGAATLVAVALYFLKRRPSSEPPAA